MMAVKFRMILLRVLILAPLVSLAKLVFWLLATAIAVSFAVLGTEAGSSFLISTAREQSNGSLHYESQRGSFLNGVTLSELLWHQAGTQLSSNDLRLEFDLFPPRIDLVVGEVQVNLTNEQRNGETTQTKLITKSFSPPRLFSPIPVHAEITLGNTVINNNGRQLVRISATQTSLALIGSQLTLAPTQIISDRADLELAGSIRLAGNFDSQLKARLAFATRQQQAQSLLLLGSGPLSQLQLSLTSNGPNAVEASATANLRARPVSWSADLSKLEIDLESLIKSPPLALNGQLSSNGEVGNAAIDGELSMQQTTSSGKVDHYQIPSFNIRWLETTFSGQDITVKSPYAWLQGAFSFSLHEGWPLSINAKGEITPPGLYPQPVEAQVEGSLESADIQVNFANAPAGELSLNGNLRLLDKPNPKWQANLSSPKLAIHKLVKHVPELYAKAELESFGWVEAASLSGALSSEFDGNQHRLPQFKIEWSPQQWELLPAKLYSSYVDTPTLLNASFRAGRNIPATLQVEATAPDSKLNIQGELHPKLALQWDSNIKQLETLFPLVAGSLISDGHLRGDYPNEVYTVQGSWAGSQLKLGSETIGSIQASAALTNQLNEPINLAVTAKQIDLFSWQANKAEISLDGALSQHEIQFDLVSPALNVNTRVSGELKKGKQQNWLQAQWNGLIQDWFSVGTEIPVARLNDQAKIQLSANNASLSHSCWDLGFAQLEPSTSCLEIHWRKQQPLNWEVIGNLENLPLYWLGARIPDGKVSGLANGEFAANFQWPVQPKQLDIGAIAQARLELLPTTVERSIGGKPYTLARFETGSSEIIWDEGQLSGTLSFQANNQAWLRLQPRVKAGLSESLHLLQNEPKQFFASAIDGSAEWYIPELNLLPLLLPQIETINGVSEANFMLLGSIENPELVGDISAVANRLTIPDIGLDLEHLELSLRPIQQGVKIEALARAAGTTEEQSLTADGAVFWQPSLNGKLNLNGKRFPLLNTLEARISASPNLTLSLDERELRYHGKIRVDEAHIAPRVLQEGVTKASSDQVFIDDENQDTERQRWKLHGDVEITLGDSVTLDASGLKARLTGKIRVLEEPGRRTRGIGEIQIAEGKFQAFGQQLRIDPGRLIFNNADISDPALDARAIRKLDQVTVGATVRGTVSQPEVELFSSPALSQTDALSYLVLGRPLQDESTSDVNELDKAISAIQLTGAKFLAKNLREKLGIDIFKVEVDDGGRAALVMSKYLSPRFYVSYGLDAFDAKTRLLMRYTISDSWRLEAESDGKTSSGDLKFTLERD